MIGNPPASREICACALDSLLHSVTYIGRNSTVSTRHRKNQRLSKTPPPSHQHISAKARDFVRSQNKEKWPREDFQETHSFHDDNNNSSTQETYGY